MTAKATLQIKSATIGQARERAASQFRAFFGHPVTASLASARAITLDVSTSGPDGAASIVSGWYTEWTADLS